MKKTIMPCVTLLILIATTACMSGTANAQNNHAQSKAGYTFEDVEITAVEFDSASLGADQWQYIRSKREPTAEDTVIIREWFAKHGLEFAPEKMDEYGFYAFEGNPFIEIWVGDYCETRFLDDITSIVGCNMKLATEAAGSVVLAWGVGDMFEEPEYIYIYPFDITAAKIGKSYFGKPYIYETTPKWCPAAEHQFWGADNWFYVEGYNRDNEKVYHKVRAKALSGK